MNFSYKRIIKVLIKFFIVFVSLVVVFALLINLFLILAKKNIINDIYRRSRQRIFVKMIFYIPPTSFILKNVYISGVSYSQDNQINPPLTVRTTFSLKQLLINRNISLTSISFYHPEMNYSDLLFFLKNNLERIINLIVSLPREESFKLSVKRSKIIVAQRDNLSSNILVTLSLKVKNEKVKGSGLFITEIENSLQRKSALNEPLKCVFNGRLTKSGISIENLNLIKGNLYSKLWGQVSDKSLSLNGFAFVNNFLKEKSKQRPSIDIINLIKLLFHRRKISSTVVGLSRDDLNLLDINCQIELDPPSIKLKDLSFSLNNIPVMLKGNMVTSDPVSLNLILSTHYLQPVQNPHRINLNLSGSFKNQAFNGLANLDFVKKKNSKLLPRQAQLEVEKLAFLLNENLFPELHLASGVLQYKGGDNSYSIRLDNLAAIFNLQDKRYKFVEFVALFCGGILDGRGRIDTASIPLRNIFSLNLKDVNANRLEGILSAFAKIKGKLSSQMCYKDFPDTVLNGEMIINDGELNNLDFFNWLADFFGISELRIIDFNKLTATFSVNPTEAKLKEILLRSDGVDLDGNFKLYKDNLVSSKLSLALERKLLERSSKFRPLLKLLGKDAENLKFDFQLSGVLSSMNFQWLESDFKNRLRNSIPDFIERKIEKNVEKILDPISQ